MLEDREVQRLSSELGRLSEFEEQNKERMLEIARVLVDHYMHRDSQDQTDKHWPSSDPDILPKKSVC